MRISPSPVLLLALLLCGCGESAKPVAAADGVGLETRFPLNIGASTLKTRVAITELELSTGLMNTASLPKDEGMLFAYRDTGRRAFWMKDVPYDIDIGFFDAEGKLAQVTLLKAENLEVVETDSDAIRYAVEAPASWYAGHGVRAGAKLDLRSLAKAIRDRGFAEKDFTDVK